MKHILQLIETDGPGGAERVLINLTQRLNRSGNFRVSVGILKEGWLHDRLIESDVPVHMLPSKHSIDFPFLFALMRLIKTQKVDLIHSHEFTMNFYGSLAGKLLGIPVVATVHGKNYYSTVKRRIYAMRLLRRMGTAVVAVSSDIRDFLQKDLGLHGVRVIPNGIDIQAYRNADRNEARRMLGFSGQDKVIGAVGNLYPVKGHAVLLEALARLGNSNTHVVIAGRGEEENRLRLLIESLSLQGRVHLLGFREDVPRLLSALDVYAMPSFSEGQSLALMEAMAAGLPIVASRVGGNPELLRENETGLLFETGNAEDLAAKIKILLEQPETAGRVGANAQERAAKEFSLDAMMERYLALYSESGLEIPHG